jgi:hypothetical protein
MRDEALRAAEDVRRRRDRVRTAETRADSFDLDLRSGTQVRVPLARPFGLDIGVSEVRRQALGKLLCFGRRRDGPVGDRDDAASVAPTIESREIPIVELTD